MQYTKGCLEDVTTCVLAHCKYKANPQDSYSGKRYGANSCIGIGPLITVLWL